jgi:indolepyruvate ferredoxin oxidoreductase beta subunit
MQIIINGVGGQGVLFLSKILSKAALCKGENVLASETIGMAQRGGSVFSFIKIGSDYHSPVIIQGNGDILICLNEKELENGKCYLKPDGTVFVNSSDFFDATEVALKYNKPAMANMIFLGYIVNFKNFPFAKDEILKVIPESSVEFFNIGFNAFNR